MSPERNRSDPAPKWFTVEEADQVLPEVRDLVRVLREIQQRIRTLQEKKAVEELCWLKEDGTVSPNARAELERLELEHRKELAEFEAALAQMDRIGAHLKDLDEGLIDFFARRNEERVFLCWKQGEDRIRWWHDLESGFAGRRPMEEW